MQECKTKATLYAVSEKTMWYTVREAIMACMHRQFHVALLHYRFGCGCKQWFQVARRCNLHYSHAVYHPGRHCQHTGCDAAA